MPDKKGNVKRKNACEWLESGLLMQLRNEGNFHVTFLHSPQGAFSVEGTVLLLFLVKGVSTLAGFSPPLFFMPRYSCAQQSKGTFEAVCVFGCARVPLTSGKGGVGGPTFGGFHLALGTLETSIVCFLAEQKEHKSPEQPPCTGFFSC